MGRLVGVFTDEEVQELSEKDKELLRTHIVQQMRTSAEIAKVLQENPKLLTGDPKIREILRKRAAPLQKRLKKNK
jgi:hypothetical protein